MRKIILPKIEGMLGKNMTDRDKVKIGMEATMRVGSDRYPYIVVSIERRGQVIWLEELDAVPAERFDYFSNQVYSYKRMVAPQLVMAVWRPKRQRYYSAGCPIGIGHADKYSDPCF